MKVFALVVFALVAITLLWITGVAFYRYVYAFTACRRAAARSDLIAAGILLAGAVIVFLSAVFL